MELAANYGSDMQRENEEYEEQNQNDYYERNELINRPSSGSNNRFNNNNNSQSYMNSQSNRNQSNSMKSTTNENIRNNSFANTFGNPGNNTSVNVGSSGALNNNNKRRDVQKELYENEFEKMKGLIENLRDELVVRKFCLICC